MHEVLHAVIFLVGVHEILFPELSQEEWSELEEKLVLLLAIPLFEALLRSGFLKFKPIPKLPKAAGPTGPISKKRGPKCRSHGPKRTSNSASRSCVHRAA
jgi:hypothetical protein